MAKPNFILPNKPAIKAGSILSYNYTDDLKFAAEPLDFSRNGSATRVNEQGLIETTSANISRIDYSDSSTEPSLLLEPQSTNLITYSEDFSQWIKYQSSVNTNEVISPDGSLNADKIIENTANSTHFVRPIVNNIPSSGTATLSVFAKKGENNWIKLVQYTNYVNFDLNNGVVGNSSAISSSIINYGNGWYKCIMNFNISGSGANVDFKLGENNTSNWDDTYTGDGTSGVYLWGAQSEALSYATSYIPTLGSTATRLGETANNAGGAGVFNSEEGVLYAEIKTLSQTGTFRQINLSNGTASSRIYISKRAENNNFEFRMDNPSGSLNFSFPLDTTSSFVKLAFRYGLNNFAVFINGVNKNVSSTGNVFSSGTLNNLEFSSPLNQPFYGKTKNLKVFNYALTDEELQTLTT